MRALLAIVLAVGLSGCATAPPRSRPPSREPFRIIGYVRSYSGMDDIDAAKLTHINYAFAKVNPLGLVEFEEPAAPSDLARLQALKRKNPALRLIVSVGGWGADFFSDAAVSDGARCRFADSAVEMLNRYALDGIDLDWEYPGDPGPGMQFRREDKENFTAMLRTLREELDMLSDARGRKGADRYILTIASSGADYFERTEMTTLHRYLDWINVMTYDFAGSWTETAGHHTPLYRSAAAPKSLETTETFIQQHLAAGIPSRKIVVGVAFYGRGWIRSQGLYKQTDRYENEYSYAELARDYLSSPKWQRRWDAAARAPYLWNQETGRLISYDDPQSLSEKAAFVKKYNLGGIMYWEHSHDPDEVLLRAIYDALQ